MTTKGLGYLAHSNRVKTIAGCSMLVLSTLTIWRLLYTGFAYSWLFLLPLFAASVIGSYLVIVESRQANLDAALNHETWLRKWLKGRVYAAIFSLAFSIIATCLFAYKALVIGLPEFFILMFSFSFSVWMYCQMFDTLRAHVNLRYLPMLSTSFTCWIVGSASFLVYAYWVKTATYPGEIRVASLAEVLDIKVQELPQGYGFVAQIIEWFTAIDALKLYAVVQASNLTRWAVLVFIIHSAAVVFIVVRFATSIAEFLRVFILKERNENGQ